MRHLLSFQTLRSWVVNGFLIWIQSSPFSTFLLLSIRFCRPYLIKNGKTRSYTSIKCYISISICFSTRAVHVEFVTDLTSEAFLKAFKSFVYRRGLCEHIYSDNAKNFVGANNELLELYQNVQNSIKQNDVHYFKENQVKWHFIPPRFPHCGGLNTI